MVDIRVLELACSRLCHDLVSPVGAIRNGLEILEETGEDGGDFRDEAIRLIEHAAAQADGRLRVFRLAYGSAGRNASGFHDARAAAQAWFATGRVRLDWPAGTPPDATAQRRGVVKAALNFIVLADEALTHGGEVSLSGRGDDLGGEIAVTAVGRPGALSDELRAALDGRTAVEDLSPRAVHACAAGLFLRSAGLACAVDATPGERLVFRLSW